MANPDGTPDGTRKELKNTGYEIFIGILSILSIVNIVMIYVAQDPNLDTVIDATNWLLSIIFLGDFTYRLFTTQSRPGACAHASTAASNAVSAEVASPLTSISASSNRWAPTVESARPPSILVR